MKRTLRTCFAPADSHKSHPAAAKVKRSLYAGLLAGFMLTGLSLPAQFNLNCPSNMVVAAGANCDAAVTYPAPFVTGGSVADTMYAYTGSPQIYVVPPSVGLITIEAWGAQGCSNASNTTLGGLGGYSTGQLAVTPGETLHVYVGGGGISSIIGGFNGGGNAGTTLNCPQANAGGGGGGTDLRQGGMALTNRAIIAGGGGGAGGDRINACGRGSGGGGGAGYYGGGGGAGWPGATGGTLPTGGTQSAGGTGGIKVSAAGATDGTAGSLGQGGTGGDEVGSNQGGGAVALPGGAGGGNTGGIGAFVANWTGQSGAGGSGFLGTLTSASAQTGIRTGSGQLRIIAPVTTNLVQTAGIASGATFQPGITTNAFTVIQNNNTDSCSFTVDVQDLTGPVFTCPGLDSLYVGANCDAACPDYTLLLTPSDNCDPNPAIVQTPASGTLVNAGTLPQFSITATDAAGNQTLCQFQVELIDTIAPTVVSCPSTIIYHPSTLDCDSQAVNYPLPIFADNCLFGFTSSHSPGDVFSYGPTVITYVATDSAGNTTVCNFLLSVESPVLDGIISTNPVCENTPFTMTAQPGFSSYLWSTGATTTSMTSSTPGWFWVNVTDGNGCTGRDSAAFVYPAPPAPQLLGAGNQICTDPFASYQWYLNSTLIPGATAQCYQPTMNGTYSVVVFDSIGCQGISDTSFFVGVNPGAQSGFEIFPNPAQDMVQVRLNVPIQGACRISIFDLAGNVVQVVEKFAWGAVFSVDLKGLAAGSYLLELSAADFKGMRRLVRIP